MRYPFTPLAWAATLCCLISTAVAADTAAVPSATTTRNGAPQVAGNYLQRDEVRRFLDELSRQSDIDRQRLSGILARARHQPSIIEAISRPAERTLNWAAYRPIFLTEERLAQGRAFMREHAHVLERARQVHGVPPSVITAIIGVETFYGRITGSHDVLDALATLAFDYPPRADFFRGELAEFLVLSEKEGWNPHQRQGSYAGAMGMPQFISSSYRAYAVDFDGDGQRDLFDSVEDVIGSVANYLSVHGWQRGAPVAAPWIAAGDAISQRIRSLDQGSLKPDISAEEVRALGFDHPSLAAGTADGEALSVMVLEAAAGEEVWVGYRNFYVITRYNHSHLYAMAVWQLAQGLQSPLE